MNNLAYADRDISAIRRRQQINFLYKGLRKLCRYVHTDLENVTTILVYPVIKNKEILADLLNRIAWALPVNSSLQIKVVVSSNLKSIDISSLKTPEHQRNYLLNISSIQMVDGSETDFSKTDIILLHDKSALKELLILKQLHKIEIIDKNYFSTEESETLRSVFYKTLSKKEKYNHLHQSKLNFHKLIKKHNMKNKSYCFATGPSFDRYKEFEYDNSFKVICNSTVKNAEFLEYIGGPDVLVFADPVFHFSPCEYSALFRDHVISVVRKYGCFVIVQEYTVPLLTKHYPELTNFLIGMPIGKDFNIPSYEKFYVKGFSNILTLYMLPIASAISDEIFIIGADGRNPDEKYFWKHSSSAQYDNLMETVFETHPSFFRDRDYADYYQKHCKNLEKLITYGESFGKNYFSLTESYIPALKKRQNKIGKEQR
jgi:hypothetical protein